MALCSTCREREPRTNQRTCRDCHAAYVRAWRSDPANHREPTEEETRKDRCRKHSKMLQQRGWLVPQPCEACGETKVERHHEDYDNPYFVRWLCRQHHKAVDRRLLILPYEKAPIPNMDGLINWLDARGLLKVWNVEA